MGFLGGVLIELEDGDDLHSAHGDVVLGSEQFE
jgi:hypothetical protein